MSSDTCKAVIPANAGIQYAARLCGLTAEVLEYWGRPVKPGGDLNKKRRRDIFAPAFVLRLKPSVQLFANFSNALGQETVGDLALH